MQKSEVSSVLEAAEIYINKGWAVMPCLPKKKEPHFGLIKRSHLDATNDLDLVKFWSKMDPSMNLGISAIKSKLVIIDIDYRNGGYFKDEWMDTFVVKSGDGVHLYYEHFEGVQYRSTFADGFDVKFKGYVVAAPSIHPSGSHYEIINDAPVNKLPTEIEEVICRPQW